MIDLPETTNIYGRVPKEVFYKHMTIYPELKKKFMDETQSITWRNILSPETMTVTPGKNVEEIAVIEIILSRQAMSQSLLELLAREIEPYTVFIVRYEDWGQIWFCRKEAMSDPNGQFRCDSYQTSWLLYEDLELKLEGENLDQIFTNFLNHIPGAAPLIDNQSLVHNTEAFDRQGFEAEVEETENEKKDDEKSKRNENLETPEYLEQLEATRKDLETQVDLETQFSIQLKLVGELRRVKEEIHALKSHRMIDTEGNKPEIMDPNLNNLEWIRAHFPNVVLKISDEKDNLI